ncbi:MAG: DUF4145 domain-containing protein [Halanaerobiales bacterium]
MGDNKMEVVDCQHCGNKTYMDIIGDHRECKTHHDYIEGHGEVPMFQETNEWKLFMCPVCNNVTLIEVYWNDMHLDGNGGFEHKEILYPTSTFNNLGVPDNVSSAFNVSIKAKHVDPSVCLISLRRTLEMICKDHGIHKGTLGFKLKEMVNKNILPSVLDDASYLLKELGNEAAHGDDIKHSENDVNEMIEYTEYIINYVYVLPYKIKKVQTRKGEE